MQHYHAAVWIDHEQARLFSLNADTANEWTLRPHDHHVHLHHKANTIGSGKAAPDIHYFDSVAAALAGAGEILVVGPSSAKLEFLRYLQKRHPDIEKKIVAVETVDHPTDGELLNFVRKSFHAVDEKRALNLPEKSSDAPPKNPA